MKPSKISGNWIVFRYIYLFFGNCHIFMYCGVFYQCSTCKSFFFQSPHASSNFIFFHSIFHNPNLYTTYSIPFISLLRDSGSHYVIICISKWRAQQDTQLHSTNSILSGGIFTNAELPELFQLLSILISCWNRERWRRLDKHVTPCTRSR